MKKTLSILLLISGGFFTVSCQTTPVVEEEPLPILKTDTKTTKPKTVSKPKTTNTIPQPTSILDEPITLPEPGSITNTPSLPASDVPTGNRVLSQDSILE